MLLLIFCHFLGSDLSLTLYCVYFCTNEQTLTGIRTILFFFFLSGVLLPCYAQQKIGVVLSGGGAAGLAHIGVLKALEENHIPIDYICGTSAGALVGSMYACGMSPMEMEAFVTSRAFQLMTSGEIPSGSRFLYREKDPNASMLSLPFSPDSLLQTSIPMNIIRPIYLDFEMLKLMGQIGASSHRNFDSLLVPFRCVGSDVINKKSVVFSAGDLNAAVRASMTYPLYVNPIKIDQVIYFDGGLYNNFPVNVMYQEFSPDVIIGSNVSDNTPIPDEQNFIGLLDHMTRTPTNYEMPCAQGIIISPNITVGTFDFGDAKQAIQEGYEHALLYIDSIKRLIPNQTDTVALKAKRALLNAKSQHRRISSMSTEFHGKRSISYASQALIRSRKKEQMTWEKFENRYFRLYAAEQVDYLFPTLSEKKDSTYHLNLYVRRSKPLLLSVGGHLSSRPVNTGYIGLTYRHIGRTATSIHAESYFGKFYGSAKGELSLDIPGVFPVSASAYFVMNRWDYFRSFATFFEDVKPSFLIQNEMYYGVKIKHPILNNSKAVFDVRWFNLEDDYYQTQNFLSTDTADMTLLNGSLLSYEITDNSLNRKQFANEGHFLTFKIKYLTGLERTVPGTTAQFDSTVTKQHDWLNINMEGQYYFLTTPHFHLGIHGKAMFNSQSLFANYTASLLSMPTLNVIPDLETYFFKEYRSPQFFSVGANVVVPITKGLEYRLDVYYYQPFLILQKLDDGSIQYSKPFKGETWLASTSLLYHTPLGPIRATLNYFPKQAIPLNFQMSFGYVLFNERAVR